MTGELKIFIKFPCFFDQREAGAAGVTATFHHWRPSCFITILLPFITTIRVVPAVGVGVVMSAPYASMLTADMPAPHWRL